MTGIGKSGEMERLLVGRPRDDRVYLALTRQFDRCLDRMAREASRADGARAILTPFPAAEPPGAYRDPLLGRQLGDLIFRPYDGDLRLGRLGQCPGRDLGADAARVAQSDG
jgi:hypothetical protein